MWLDSKAVNCPQKWGNFKGTLILAVEGEAEVVVTGLITMDGLFISAQSFSRIE